MRQDQSTISMAAFANTLLAGWRQSSPSPAILNDDAAIAQGHRERRELLARRRAEQQLEAVLVEAKRLGIQPTAAAIVRIVVDTYTDTLKMARR